MYGNEVGQEPPTKRRKQNAATLSSACGVVYGTTSKGLSTKDQLLNCITNCSAQYMCQDLGLIITEYAHDGCLEIITRHSAMRFDNASRKWTFTTFPDTTATIASVEGRLYAVGRFDTRCYVHNYASQQWTPVTSMKTRRSNNYCVGALNGKLFVVGGNMNYTPSHNVEYYNDSKNEWLDVASMTSPRSDPRLGVLNGKMYAIGGFGGRIGMLPTGEYFYGWLRTVECYDDIKNQWTQVESMIFPRRHFGVGVLHDKLYAMGGWVCQSAQNTVECYDDVTNQWTMVAPMNTARASHGVGVLDNKLYAVGGHNEHGRVYTVERYDDVSNTWSMVPNMTLDDKDFCKIWS